MNPRQAASSVFDGYIGRPREALAVLADEIVERFGIRQGTDHALMLVKMIEERRDG